MTSSLSRTPRTFGGKGRRSKHYKSDSRAVKIRRAFMVCSASTFGNSASDWSVSPQSPPTT